MKIYKVPIFQILMMCISKQMIASPIIDNFEQIEYCRLPGCFDPLIQIKIIFSFYTFDYSISLEKMIVTHQMF